MEFEDNLKEEKEQKIPNQKELEKEFSALSLLLNYL